MSNTNDPQALYGAMKSEVDAEGKPLNGYFISEIPGLPKPTERAPLLSAEEAGKLTAEHAVHHHDFTHALFSPMAIAKVIDFYENLINSGELRVVKTTRNGHENGWECDHCQRLLGSEVEYNYCPGCGAEIAKG